MFHPVKGEVFWKDRTNYPSLLTQIPLRKKEAYLFSDCNERVIKNLVKSGIIDKVDSVKFWGLGLTDKTSPDPGLV